SAATAELHEPFGLLLFFDALGDDIHAEPFAHGEYGADDMFRRPVVEKRGDEGAIYLQLVELEFSQPSERRLAGAEIVEGDPDAAAAQVFDDLFGRCRIGHQAGLGDLDLQPARVESGPVEDRQYVQAGVLVDELRGRQVERQE